MKHEKNFTQKLADFMKLESKRSRKKITTVEKIDLSRFFTEKIPKRNAMSAYLKQQIYITFEVRDMFRLVEPTQLDAQRQTDAGIETRGLAKLQTITKTKINKRNVFVPTAEQFREDPVLGLYAIKKDFITKKVKVSEKVQELDWNKLTKKH